MSAETLRRAAEAIRDEDPGCKAMHGCPWHGTVALAVADWLDAEAGAVEFDGGRPDLLSAQSLAVASAYLGEGQ